MFYVINYENNTVELYFDRMPASEIRFFLKSNGWRWNPEKRCWFSHHTQQSVAQAENLGAKSGGKYHDAHINTSKEKTDIGKLLAEQTKIKDFENLSLLELDRLLCNIVGPTPKIVQLAVDGDGIVVIIFTLSGKIITIGIVQDVKYQNTEKNIYWIDRKLSRRIIYGLLNARPWILYNGEPALIISYSNTSLYQKIATHSKTFSNYENLVDVWVYHLKMPCYSHTKDVESVTAYIHTTKGKTQPINVYYCKNCKKYYINEETYRDFVKKYGFPMLRTRQVHNECTERNTDYSQFAEESLLHLMGYNVNAVENLSSEERQHILLYAIATNALTKTEILSFLEYLIYRNEGKMKYENACSRWREDLVFLRQYQIDTQRDIEGVFRSFWL